MTEPQADTQPACRELNLSATVDDAFDGAVRLLVDAQRFGFRIRALRLDAPDDGPVHIALTLAVPESLDPGRVCARLSRHPTVIAMALA